MKHVPNETELIDHIDQQLAESDCLAAALIFIAENTEDYQIELMRHSAVTLAWAIRDKLRLALIDAGRMAA